MHTEIKKYADCGDIKSLKYIFADSLDVDPTFVQYEEEYNYCKSIPGLLEPHVELTPFRENPADWDEAYWTSLKQDLTENFSDRRMSHMREVAQVLLADKIKKLLAEREARRIQQEAAQNAAPVQTTSAANVTAASDVASGESAISQQELQAKILEEQRRKLAEENREFETQRQREEQRRQQSRQKSAEQQNGDGVSKKAIGIAVAAVTVAVILILLLK